jgi:hypothetical protein
LSSRSGAHAAPKAGEAVLRVSFALRPDRLFALACAVFAALSVLNVLAIVIYDPGVPRVERIARLLLFAREASFPMLFNFLLLLGNGFVLILAALRAYGARDPGGCTGWASRRSSCSSPTTRPRSSTGR